MHQRPGKSYRAAAFDGPDKIDTRSLVNLFKDAKEQTDGDVSFYMEQQKSISVTVTIQKRDWTRLLGF